MNHLYATLTLYCFTTRRDINKQQRQKAYLVHQAVMVWGIVYREG